MRIRAELFTAAILTAAVCTCCDTQGMLGGASYSQMRNYAHQLATVAELKNLGICIEMYQAQFGLFPSADSIDGLVLELREQGISNQLKTEDSWGSKFVFQHDGKGNYSIISLGADRRPGPPPSNPEEIDRPEEDIVLFNGVVERMPARLVDPDGTLGERRVR